ncbi:uncharacterized protein G2W53_001576 [Senna tora]|uniref:Uncharacterized protein n=1 Tax=Senna tora TaxID=362788 RepID=A0A834XIZ6_9FABA|nr:uncharacterized protein G2W53_001576 [Senna tora]
MKLKGLALGENLSQADSISRLALPQGEAPTANVDIDPKKIVEYRVEAASDKEYNEMQNRGCLGPGLTM